MSEPFSGMTPVKFGERLRSLRKRDKLTQQDVADYLQIHRTTYTKYETRCVTPDQEGLVRLAALFGVSVDYLLGRTVDDATPKWALEDGATALRLTEQEVDLILSYRKLTEQQRQAVLQQTKQSTKKEDA